MAWVADVAILLLSWTLYSRQPPQIAPANSIARAQDLWMQTWRQRQAFSSELSLPMIESGDKGLALLVLQRKFLREAPCLRRVATSAITAAANQP